VPLREAGAAEEALLNPRPGVKGGRRSAGLLPVGAPRPAGDPRSGVSGWRDGGSSAITVSPSMTLAARQTLDSPRGRLDVRGRRRCGRRHPRHCSRRQSLPWPPTNVGKDRHQRRVEGTEA
jgi:hypothetical protein